MTASSPIAKLVALLCEKLLPATAQTGRAALAGFTDARELLRHLVQRGWLTPWQANELVLGRGLDLVLGRYVLLERLGQGGMGQVFKARHRLLERTDAVKLIHPNYVSRAGAVQRFLREARAAARLNHPHLVTVYDAAADGSRYYMAMEFVPGIDLDKLVQRQGPLPWPLVASLLYQAALGLQHAHEKGLVHRDLKPSNLLLSEASGQVKIVDLGLARILDDGARTAGSLTAENAVMGTPDYMAPEQALDTHRADVRADLYSLGCTAYHLLAGQVPFPGGSNLEKALRHRLEQPRPLEQYRTDVPRALSRIVGQLLAKAPADRHQTPAELAEDLCPLLSDVPPPPTVMESPPTDGAAPTIVAPPLPESVPAVTTLTPAALAETSQGPSRKARLLVLAGLAITGLLGVVAGWLLLTALFRGEHPSSGHRTDPAAGPRHWQLGPTLEPPRGVAGPPLGVFGVALSADGQLLAVACGNLNEAHDPAPVALYEVAIAKWTVLGSQRHAGRRLAFTPDGKTLISVTGTDVRDRRLTGDVNFWDVPQRKLLRTVNATTASLQALTVDNTGRWLVVAGRETGLALFDLATGAEPTRAHRPHKNVYSALALAPGSLLLAAGTTAGVIELTEGAGAVQDRLLVPPGRTARVSGLAFRVEGAELVCTTGASPGQQAEIRLWDMKTRHLKSVIPHGDASIVAMALGPDGRTLATGDQEGYLRLWDLETAKPMLTVKAHAGPVYSVCFAADGRSLASGSSDGKARLWVEK